MKNLRLLPLLLFLMFPLSGESVRGNVAGILHIIDDTTESPVDLLLDELCFFQLDSENPFLSGVEIRVTIPRNLQQYRNSFALYLYRDISPLPHLQEFRYQASQVTMHILPTQNLLSFKIPLSDKHDYIKDATSVVSPIIPASSFPIALTLLPIMKGIPDIAYEYPLSVTAQPIYYDQGGLLLSLEGESLGDDITLLIDGQVYSISEDYIPLSPGLHSLSISSKDSGTAEYNVEIQRGQITELHHTMRLEPSYINIPEIEGVLFLIDGMEVETGEHLYSPGIYKIDVRFNEDFSISEEVELSPGQKISIALDLDIIFENRQ